MIRRFSLKRRIGAALVLCILLFGLLTSLFLYGAVRNALLGETRKRGAAIAHGLQNLAVTPLLTENVVTLSLMLDETLRNGEGIRYLFVVDRHGHPVAHTFGDRFPDDLLRKTAPPVPEQCSSTRGRGSSTTSHSPS